MNSNDDLINKIARVVDEKIAARLGPVNDRLGIIENHLQTVDDNLNSVGGRLDSVDDNLNSVGGRLDSVDDNLNSVGGRLDSVDDNLNSVGGRLDSIEKRQKRQGKDIAYVRKTLDVAIDHFDRRDIKLKKKVERIEDHLRLPSM